MLMFFMKCPFQSGYQYPHVTHGSFGPRESVQKGISIGSSVSVVTIDQHIDSLKNARRDHATPSVAIARISAMHAMQANIMNNNDFSGSLYLSLRPKYYTLV